MALGAYDSNGIWQYGEDDNISLFSDLLKLGTASTSTAFTADRARLATLEAGSLSGLIPVKASSIVVVTGTAAVSSIGTVTFSGATSLSLNGIHTAAYKNYLAVITGGSSVTCEIWLRMRYAGTDQITAYNRAQAFNTDSGALSASSVINAAQYQVGDWTTGANGSNAIVEIGNPAGSERTVFNSQATGQGGISRYGGGRVTVDRSFDGLTLLPSTGTMSGTITVYGYNN